MNRVFPICVSLALVFVTSMSSPVHIDDDSKWEDFKRAFDKVYQSPEDEAIRRQIFFETSDIINAHNERFKMGLTTYSMKMNRFGDMLPYEVYPIPNSEESPQNNNSSYAPNNRLNLSFISEKTSASLPTFVDWRNKGVVTKVKDQGQCGSCWAFSTTGTVEGQHAIKTGHLISLSEQQLMDCSVVDGNKGCVTGWVDRAYHYIAQNGISSENAYPYHAKDGRCEFKKQNVAATVLNYVAIPSGDEFALQEAVALKGPISVSIDASSKHFHHYYEGVFDQPICSKTTLHHAVLVVGYGNLEGVPYWIVKNSWGSWWGNKGYILMRRNDDNQCGIATRASYPIV